MGIPQLINSGPHLGELTWPEAAEHSRSVLLVPLGATEQHGPHLPLDTDTCIIEAIAARVAVDWTGLVVAPALAYGSSGEHQGFAGSISIGPEALEHLLVELVRSASEQFWGVCLICWHGGNRAAVDEATRRLVTEGRRVLSWFPGALEGDAHAGRTETSLMLAVEPSKVRLERLAAGNTARIDDLMEALREDGVLAHSSNGVLGNPFGASEAEGVRLMQLLVDDLSARIRAWREKGDWR